MLKIILDTNLFKTNLKGLENYAFSSLYEKLIEYLNSGSIQNVELCMVETALKEYAKQMADEYQDNVVNAYNMAYNIMKDSLPVLKLDFRDKNDFMEEFYVGLVGRLKELNIRIIDTLPEIQKGGMKMVNVLDKTIKGIAPFDKDHNRNLKDAFISETINSEAQDNIKNDYLFITCNVKDFKNNTDINSNFKMAFIEDNNSKDKLLFIMKILKDNGVYIKDEIYYKEFLYSNIVKESVTKFLEINIINGNYYENTPEIKKCDDTHYALEYEIMEDEEIRVKFCILDGSNEFEGGIIFDLEKENFPMIEKYIYFSDESGEEVYKNEF